MKLFCNIAEKDVPRVRKHLLTVNKSISKGLFTLLNNSLIESGQKPLIILQHGGNRKTKKGK